MNATGHLWTHQYNNKTVLLRDTAAAADFLREIWWTVSRNYTVLFLSRDVKNTKFNQYLPVDLTSLNMPNSRFRKRVMFWRWRRQYLPVDLTSLNVSNSRFPKPVMFWKWGRHGVALWRHGRGAWHNCLLLATASNVNCWADVANLASGWYGKFRTPDHGLAMGRIMV